MGFPCLCYDIVILPKPLLLLIRLLHLFKLTTSFVLLCLGLCLSSEEYCLADTVSFSAELHPSVIKRSLPVAKFSCGSGGDAVCAVCLGTVEDGEEVRELGNCRHVFHRLCIDKWVDARQVTCPVCRAQLLAIKRKANAVDCGNGDGAIVHARTLLQ